MGIVAVLMIVASVAWESWVWAALVPPYVVVAAGLSYWSSRRMYAHVVGPGMTMTIGADDYGLIIESQAGRDAFPWERIAGVRFGRGIAMLTIVKPKARMLLPAELLPAALLAQFPARDRGRGGDRW
ncbi:PH domain-containing protein [Gordonia lacunae]|uniref:PH domain-containing protein n=1 Tax=Gordonia lacunae TaxID=417102 RepID=UPI0039E6B6BB